MIFKCQCQRLFLTDLHKHSPATKQVSTGSGGPRGRAAHIQPDSFSVARKFFRASYPNASSPRYLATRNRRLILRISLLFVDHPSISAISCITCSPIRAVPVLFPCPDHSYSAPLTLPSPQRNTNHGFCHGSKFRWLTLTLTLQALTRGGKSSYLFWLCCYHFAALLLRSCGLKYA
ncbi:LADA_0A02696g1_1 [Lachancea dasiensis]|uniref:LADA_0A02696g1_1 n=1 Tax=Lachancea dasiensis TaxID=1072105 RepID=A0A1G4IMK3_9SACH|nr:LADA_0A02696g1_1 [Lachancea dasiensis]